MSSARRHPFYSQETRIRDGDGQVFNSDAITFRRTATQAGTCARRAAPPIGQQQSHLCDSGQWLRGERKGSALWTGGASMTAIEPGDTMVVPEKAIGGGGGWKNLIDVRAAGRQPARARPSSRRIDGQMENERRGTEFLLSCCLWIGGEMLGANGYAAAAGQMGERTFAPQEPRRGRRGLARRNRDRNRRIFDGPTTSENALGMHLKNILADQETIWTSPLHLHWDDGSWLFPLGEVTGGFFATDRAIPPRFPTLPN